jgi:hypothetical protein
MKERDAVPVRAVSIRHVSGRLLIASCTASFLAVAVILMVTLEVAPVSPPGLALSASAQKASSLLANLERARPAQEASRALSWLASEEQRLAVEDPARAEAKKTLTERERLKAESAKDMANPSKVVAEAGKELAKTSKVSRAKPSKVAEAAKDWARAVDVDETRPLVEKQMQERVDHAKALLKEEVAAAKAKAQAAKAKAQATLNASAQEQRPATAQEDRNDLTLKGAPPSFIAQAEAELQGDRLQVDVQGVHACVCVDPSHLFAMPVPALTFRRSGDCSLTSSSPNHRETHLSWPCPNFSSFPIPHQHQRIFQQFKQSLKRSWA